MTHTEEIEIATWESDTYRGDICKGNTYRGNIKTKRHCMLTMRLAELGERVAWIFITLKMLTTPAEA